jgi:hypothetical protein
MAISYSCDGCGEPAESPQRRGLAIVREYCETCIVEVDSYLAARDKIHDNLSAQWIRRMVGLQKEAREDRYGLKLPDVPSDGPDAVGLEGPRGTEASSSSSPDGHPSEETPVPKGESKREQLIAKARAEGHDV